MTDNNFEPAQASASNQVERPEELFFRKILLAFLVTITSLLMATEAAQADYRGGMTPLLAQFEPDSDTGSTDNSGGIDMTKVYKGIGIGFGVIVVFFITYLVIYPTVLKGGKVWPVTLYGRCSCIAWILSWTIATIVLWNDLPMQPGDTFWTQQGLRVAFISIALVFGILWLFVWRSDTKEA